MLYDKNIIETIGQKLLSRKLTLAVAESVTSGHLQASLSLAPNGSGFFQGGMTAYNIGQKCRHLLVEPTHALECDCVSERVSGDMARAITRLFSSDYGIGITGYAALKPEAGIHELFAYISICFHDRILVTERIIAPVMDSLYVQVYYVNRILEKLEEAII